MKKYQLYLRLELKRLFLAMPAVIAGIILVFCIFAGICFVWNTQQSSTQTTNEKIAIVMDENEPGMDWLLSVLTSTKTMKENYEFVPVPEENINEQLQKGIYSMAFLVPSNYIQSLMDGSNKAIVVRFSSENATISSYFMSQFTQTVSNIIVDTETSIYTMNDCYYTKNLPNQPEDERDLLLSYIKTLLSRGNLFQTEEIKVYGNMSFEAYYFCVAFLLLLLSFGLIFPLFYKKHTLILQNILERSGISKIKQITTRYFSLTILFFFVYLFVCTIFLCGNAFFQIPLPKLPISKPKDWFIFFIGMLPVLPFICAYLHLIMEWCQDTFVAILSYFISIILMAYLSGYFYPLSFLPEALQKTAPFIPTGLLFNYAKNQLMHKINHVTLAGIILYMLLFILLSFVSKLVSDYRKE